MHFEFRLKMQMTSFAIIVPPFKRMGVSVFTSCKRHFLHPILGLSAGEHQNNYDSQAQKTQNLQKSPKYFSIGS
jgi:hypothetical protein